MDRHTFSSWSIFELAAAFQFCNGMYELDSRLSNQPRYFNTRFATWTNEQFLHSAQDYMNAIVKEIEARVPHTDTECSLRLEILITHEFCREGRPQAIGELAATASALEKDLAA